MASEPSLGTSPIDLKLYESLARFYDANLDGFSDDLALYAGLAQRANVPILDLGCGTGRIVDFLVQAGHQVVGIDCSAAMLARARVRLARHGDRARLVQADMRALPLCGSFGLAICALDSFLHLGTTADQRACLRSLRPALSKGGSLALDLPGPCAPGWEDWSPGERPLVLAWTRTLSGGDQVAKLSSFSADAAAQTHHVTELYDEISVDGGFRRQVVEYDLRFLFPAELELLVESCGYELAGRYGDYDLGPFVAGSPRQICIARPVTTL